MATKRGFVKKIEVGRAGLVKVTLIHTDGGTGDYIIQDLDADPERFNERLSKLGILRDAMNRAEPVFVEHTATDQGEEIQRAVRISRDDLDPAANVTGVAGLVLDVIVHARNQAVGDEEEGDRADVALLATDLGGVALYLDLQAPERQVAQEQLRMLLDAETTGRLVRLLVIASAGDPKGGKIVSVAVDNDAGGFGDRQAQTIDGFVESLSLIRGPMGGGHLTSNMAHVRFTTAPAFTGPGNTVGLVAYTPITVDLIVTRNSLSYKLFKAGLRDNLRMRVAALLFGATDRPDPPDRPGSTPGVASETRGRASETDSMLYSRPAMMNIGGVSMAGLAHVDNFKDAVVGLALACELLAPLASASRGVWIKISRESLDHGPDGDLCTDGVPSSDLAPQSLRDLRVPYPAQWRGLGCFNPGVYRFQFNLDVEFTVCVDGEELCLHDAEDGDEKFAHACLGGDHEIVVKLNGWRCEYEFVMDIYRLR